MAKGFGTTHYTIQYQKLDGFWTDEGIANSSEENEFDTLAEAKSAIDGIAEMAYTETTWAGEYRICRVDGDGYTQVASFTIN